MNAITLQGLTKYYGRTRGVAGLDLCVEEGEFFGFIGPNGAGKSTAIRTLLGLLRPDSGRAELFGHSVVKEGPAVLQQVGYLPSETAFWPGIRVRQVLELSAALHRQDCAAEAARLCVALALDPAKKVDALSLGNRKKLGIVCAMQHRPRLYVLDEPTSGLDPLVQQTFFRLLQQRREEGATVFFSSHVLGEVQRHCTRAAILRDGRLAAAGTVEDLVETGVRRVTLRGLADPAAVTALEGVFGLQNTPEAVSFLYRGPLPALLQLLAAQPPEDVTITQPELEEVFLHYYSQQDGKEENGNGTVLA